jgi:prepilin-type N-terminal cleavage/methylation domain-containing protein/prepilin-type processing-associated H-X9-DG protein
MNRCPQRTSKGFTLIELMVAVSIIVMLASILLPALSGARKLARTVMCGNNMRNIGIGMQMYADDSDSAIVGNAWTSGAFLLLKHSPAYGTNYWPNVCQSWDWEAPIAQEEGVVFDQGATIADRTKRYAFLNNRPEFLCLENDIKSTGFTPPFTATTTMLSYNTALMFQIAYGSGDDRKYQNYINTGNYTPRMANVGALNDKIFLSDGARWADNDSTPPDYNLGVTDTDNKSPGGAYADYGPWSQYSRSFLRNVPITYAMRHGVRTSGPGVSLGSYRFNALFFDGHVKTLDGLTGSNPNMWLPTGAVLPSGELTTEATQAFMPGQSSLLINN